MRSKQTRLQTVRVLKFRRACFRDFIYIILCLLIIWGFSDNVDRFVHTTVRPAIADTKMRVVQARKDLFDPHPVNGKTVIVPSPTPIKVEFKDKRITRLYTYLQSKNSPLSQHAAYIVQESDNRGIDWTVVVAISGKESSWGVNMPKNSYNAWGLGGTNFMYFSSWEESIAYEVDLLANNYRLNANSGIQKKYCPDFECSPTWAEDVTAFSQEILDNE